MITLLSAIKQQLPDFHIRVAYVQVKRFSLIWAFAAALVISACSAQPDSPQPFDTPTVESTKQISEPISTVSPEPDSEPGNDPPTSTPPTENTSGCNSTSGEVIESVLRDASLFRPMPFRIYLPPCYAEYPDHSYPTLYLLHGLQFTDSQWDELGVDKVADRLISSGVIPPFMIVMPWHRTGIDLARAVPEVLVPHIERNFAASQQQAFRAIGGVSRGGGQALEIGLNYPEIFGAVGMHSPAVQYLDAIIVDWALSIPSESRPALWIDIGMRDSLYPAAKSLIGELQRNSIAITIQVNEGDHLAEYWQAHMEDYLRWYASSWRRASLEE